MFNGKRTNIVINSRFSGDLESRLHYHFLYAHALNCIDYESIINPHGKNVKENIWLSTNFTLQKTIKMFKKYHFSYIYIYLPHTVSSTFQPTSRIDLLRPYACGSYWWGKKT